MAAVEETVKILRFDTADAVRSLADLRKYIKDAKANLEELTIGSDDYNTQLRDVQKAQDALRDSMNMGVAGITAAKGSYNDLVHTMRELKQQWRATSDEAERNKLGNEIVVINSRLKQLDASVGVYGRNVGDYSNKILEAFVATGGGAAKAVGGIKNMTTGLKAMSATPAIAVLGLLANILTRLVSTLKGSEEGLNSMTKATGLLSGISEGLTRVMQGLSKGVAAVANAMANLADKLGLVTERMREKQKLAEDEIALAREQRSITVLEAQTEKEVAELREKASDTANYTAQERLAFLEQIAPKEEALAERRKAAAEEELRIYKEQHKTTLNNAEVENKIAELEAKAIRADSDLAKEKRKNNRERQRITKEIERQYKDQARAAKEAARDEKAAFDARVAAQKEYLQQLQGLAVEGSETQFKIANTLAKLENEKAKADLRAKYDSLKLQAKTNAEKLKLEEEYEKAAELYDKAFRIRLAKNREEYDEKRAKAVTLALENERDGFVRGSGEYLARQIDVLENEYENLKQKVGESDDAFLARQIAAFRALTDARREFDDYNEDQERQRLQNNIDGIRENEEAKLEAELELKAFELDALHQLEGESNEAFRAREIAAETAFYEAQRALVMKRIEVGQTWASSLSGLATAVADVLEQMGGEEEKATKVTKGLKVTAAIIDTISGAVGAFMSGVNSGIPAPYNLILAAAQAATVTATGLANVAKIKAVKVSKSASGSGPAAPAVVTAPAVVQQVPVTRTLTGASEEMRLDKMASDQRVVLVYSDVEEAARHVEVVESETDF